MLTQLHIKNIAVIQNASIALTEGLNVFTGETGAGKTILISAIDAVLGERTSRDMIRTGEEKALVSALFEDIRPEARQALEEQGYETDDGAVLIVREIHANGKNSCKINGMPATVSVLRNISSLLIHIHGQRDSHQLLADEEHLRLIDLYGKNAALLEEYREQYRTMRTISAELDSLRMDDAQKAQRMDMLSFQIREIEEAYLEDPEEEALLQNRRKIMRNSEKIRESLFSACRALSGGEATEGINSLFDELVDGVCAAAQYMDALAPLSERLSDMRYELLEAAGDLRDHLDGFEFDREEADHIEQRLDIIFRLKRKYGAGIAEILEFLEKVRLELDAITGSEERERMLLSGLEEARARTVSLGERLSKQRLKAAEAFVREIEEELVFLDMPHVKLSISHSPIEPAENGMDNLSFLIVTNPGEAPKPLSKIASGGEIARIMLAIKNVMADRDGIDTLIFDEVDSGVSGRAAGKIGQKLREASRKRQVLCVTHLAQVAAYADHHLYIYKETGNAHTATKIVPLEGDAVLHELARITVGDAVTPTALESAAEMRRHAHSDA